MKSELPKEFGKSNNTDILAHCSVCGDSFLYNNVIVIEESEQKSVMHATCYKCKSSAILFFTNNQAGIISAGMATDLDNKEAKKILGENAISADDILNVYQFLKSN